MKSVFGKSDQYSGSNILRYRDLNTAKKNLGSAIR